jgi:hypothetical protein
LQDENIGKKSFCCADPGSPRKSAFFGLFSHFFVVRAGRAVDGFVDKLARDRSALEALPMAEFLSFAQEFFSRNFRRRTRLCGESWR